MYSHSLLQVGLQRYNHLRKEVIELLMEHTKFTVEEKKIEKSKAVIIQLGLLDTKCSGKSTEGFSSYQEKCRTFSEI